MSGPYRFQGESARSPLDRTPQNLFPAGQPPSFKTNVNRMKTKKWVEARKAAYDGDDWGEYDEFDEYGTAANPEPAEPTGFRQPGRGLDQPGRSFTDPQQARNMVPVARRNSFEAGEESRAFSATYPQPSGSRQVSASHSEVSDTPQHRRDFSPSAMPQPLTTRLGGPETGAPQTGSPAPTSPTNTDKPLPFVRPADIYKRIEEERQKERASLDGSRPSLDSRKDDGQQAPVHSGPPGAVSPTTQHLGEPQAPEAISAFDSDFWSSGPQLPALGHVGQGQTQTTSPEGNSNLRAVVDQAFTRTDDQRSMPPTPISKQSDSDFSRSNTTSTTGISPIMSRVPSSATAALKLRSGAEGSTPAIAEEPSGSNTPVSQPTSATMPSGVYQVPQTPHSRNVSSSSIPQTGLATPGSVGSARSPKIEPLRIPSRPQSAIISSMPGSPESTKADLNTLASREADIAHAMRSSPDKAFPGLGAAEKESQTAFLEQHQNTQSPIDEAIPRSRSESPSKGRVHELAGKFGEVASSRRGSTQSNLSVQSWERSRENSRPSSPTKSELPGERPAAARDASFRPKLPGQWESYTTSAPTPSEQGEKDLQVENAPQGSRTSLPLGEVDLHPTTTKHPVEAPPEPEKFTPGSLTTDPLATLKAAGAAIGDAIQSSIGAGDGTSGTNEDMARGEEKRVVGDVLLSRPLHLERTASSIASSIPPTPPEKDTPASEDMPPIPPLKERSPEPAAESSSQQHTPVRPIMLPKLSTEPAEHDQESDRLRKEIVASLSPAPMEASPQQNRASLQPSLVNVNRESSFLPSEYESYWDDREAASPQREQVAPSGATDQARSPSPGLTSGPTNPVLITRFSWENGNATPAEDQASAGAVSGSTVRSPSEGPVAQQAHESMGSHTSSPVPAPEPYFGPGHTAATAPEPLTVPGSIGSALTPSVSPLEPKESLTEPKSLRESSPVSGLHVVNSALNPEAVDMPPRLNQEETAAQEPPQYSQAESQVSGSARDSKVPEPSQPHPAATSSAVPASAPKSPTSGKPLGFRDILNIKSPSERIQTYNKTREYWASADHGLHDWISAAVAADPELANGPVAPIPRTDSAPRHRHAPSLSIFGKHHGHSSSQSQSNIPAYNDSNSPAGANAPANFGSSTASPDGRPQSSSFANQGRHASLQMQAKGKDLLHTAGILGGKGMTGAKGLFAKGKSRFKSGGDKDPQAPAPHAHAEAGVSSASPSATPSTSRAASEAPDELVVEKKRRRFSLSSPFHRSSRSRSRPSSVVIPTSQPLFDLNNSTHIPRPPLLRSETTPQRRPSRGRASGEARPHSYHIPSEWNVFDATPPQAESTPPRQKGQTTGELFPPERLGVLPSPARSLFDVNAGAGREEVGGAAVPPVPRIPARWEGEVLGSVVRNSTTRGAEDDAQESGKLVEHVPKRSETVAQVPESAAVDRKGTLAAVPVAKLDMGNNDDEDVNADALLKAVEDTIAAAQEQRPEDNIDANGFASQGLATKEETSTPLATAIPLEHDAPNVNAQGGFEILADSGNARASPEVGGNHFNVARQMVDETKPTPLAAKSPEPTTNNVHRGPKVLLNNGEVPQAPPTINRVKLDTSESDGELQRTRSDEAATSTTKPCDIDNKSSSTKSPESFLKPVRSSEIGGPPPRERLTSARVSAFPTPYVVHAVQFAPSQSQSSFESWEFDSIAAPSQSDGSQLGDRFDEKETANEEKMQRIAAAHMDPHSASLMQRAQYPGDNPGLAHNTGFIAASRDNLHDGHTPTSAMASSQAMNHHPHPSLDANPRAAPQATNHKSSQSLLSAISSAVSVDGSAISPASSRAGTSSRPASRTRQLQLEGSAKVSPVTPVMTIEESSPSPPLPAEAQVLRPPPRPLSNNDYDLYADANGVVIVNGQEVQIPLSARAEGVSPMPSPRPSENGDLGPDSTTAPEEPVVTPEVEELEPRYSIERPMSFIMGPRDESGRPQDQITSPKTASNQAAVNAVAPQYAGGYAPPANAHGSNMGPLPPNNAPSPPHAVPAQVLPHRPLVRENIAQGAAVIDSRTEDLRQKHDQRQQIYPGPTHPQDPRMQIQMQGQPYQANGSMQRRAIGPQPPAVHQNDPRPRFTTLEDEIPSIKGTRVHHFGTAPSTSEEKTSKPKVTSFFKGLGNKRSSSPQAPNVPSSAIDAPELTNHKASFQASSNGLLPEQDASKKKNRRSFGILGGRPESVGRESHISHVSHASHDSTRVQVTDSRLDLRYPTDPPPFQGIPPQQPPPGVMPQPPRNASHENPETGKKKRFSGLGHLFGRHSGAGSVDSLKNKLSKEDKKGQKAQKRNTAPPTDIPPPPQWHDHSQQQNMQYGPPSLARSYTGTRGAPPQAMSLSPQARLPPDDVYQGRYVSNPLPGYPPQQYPNRVQGQNPPSESSAFMTTKQMAQQARLSMQAGPPSSGQAPVGVAEYSQRRAEQQHPPAGYFKPDSKQVMMDHGTPANLLGRTQAGQQPSSVLQTPYNRSVSSPIMGHGPPVANRDFNRQGGPTFTEPQYETPQIPAAYRHVSGAYVATGSHPAGVAVQSSAPDTRNSVTFPTPPPGMGNRQYSDPRMAPISPQISQVSGQSQMTVAQRTHSESSVSVVSPINSPSPTVELTQPPPMQRPQPPRMSSITESPHHERPAHVNLPPRATDEEFLRMYQRQHIEQQLAAQERLYTERTGQSPSPHPSRHTASPGPHPSVEPQPQPSAPNSVQGGFREVLPRNSVQSHQGSTHIIPEQEQPPSPRATGSQHLHPPAIHPDQGLAPANHPLPTSPEDVRSPLNPLVGTLPPPPPPKIPHSPMQPGFPSNPSPHPYVQDQMYLQPTLAPLDPSHHPYTHPQQYAPDYTDAPPPDEPPPYDGPALPHPGMDDKSADTTTPSTRAPRPPNIVTNAPILPRNPQPRSRQPSLNVLQHPQPASMAASPQRSVADMGAAMMMRQLSAQEEAERAERARRAEQDREKRERERIERLRNVARAEELERMAKGGGRVGSLRGGEGYVGGRSNSNSSGRGVGVGVGLGAAGLAVGGGGAGLAAVQHQQHGVAVSPGGAGWERRGSAANRQVFELPAEDDDEPVMRATSFPGMEWVPTVTED